MHDEPSAVWDATCKALDSASVKTRTKAPRDDIHELWLFVSTSDALSFSRLIESCVCVVCLGVWAYIKLQMILNVSGKLY